MILNNNDNYVITVEDLLMRKAKITDNPNFTYEQLFGKNETSDNHYLSGCRLDNKQEPENQNFQQGKSLTESENISLNKCPKEESPSQNDQICSNPRFNEDNLLNQNINNNFNNQNNQTSFKENNLNFFQVPANNINQFQYQGNDNQNINENLHLNTNNLNNNINPNVMNNNNNINNINFNTINNNNNINFNVISNNNRINYNTINNNNIINFNIMNTSRNININPIENNFISNNQRYNFNALNSGNNQNPFILNLNSNINPQFRINENNDNNNIFNYYDKVLQNKTKKLNQWGQPIIERSINFD